MSPSQLTSIMCAESVALQPRSALVPVPVPILSYSQIASTSAKDNAGLLLSPGLSGGHCIAYNQIQWQPSSTTPLASQCHVCVFSRQGFCTSAMAKTCLDALSSLSLSHPSHYFFQFSLGAVLYRFEQVMVLPTSCMHRQRAIQ